MTKMKERLTEDEQDAHRVKWPANQTADWHAATWNSRGVFDWYMTFSFNDPTHRSRRLTSPDRLHDFVEEQLRRFGYLGPFVIVAHDNSGTRYYHAHCLLSDYEPGICARLAEKFDRYGNVSKTDDGPIRGMGAFYYCANRAFPYPDVDIRVRESFKWVRRPRKRGRSRGRGSMPAGASS